MAEVKTDNVKSNEVKIKVKTFVEDMSKPYYQLIETVHKWVKENKDTKILNIVFDVVNNKELDEESPNPMGYKRVIKVFYE